MAILRELWSGEVNDEQVLSTNQYVIELRERLEQTCQLVRDNLKKVQFKQKTYYDKRARSRKFDVGDKVLLLLPTEGNKLLLQWKGPYEVVQIVNRMDYKVDVDGVVGTYHANMLKHFISHDRMFVFMNIFDVHKSVIYCTYISPFVHMLLIHSCFCFRHNLIEAKCLFVFYIHVLTEDASFHFYNTL